MHPRIALFAVATLAGVAPLAAQGHLGIVAGGVMASASTSNNVSYTLSSVIGFVGGISMDAKVSNGVSFAPEVEFAMKGAKETLITSPAVTGTVRGDYIEVPVLLRVMLGRGRMRPFVTFGPEASFKVTCKLTVAGAGAGFDGTGDCNKSTDSTSGVKSTDFGVIGGIGVAGERISLSVRYDIGLVNIARDPTVGAVTAKNRAFMAIVGIRL